MDASQLAQYNQLMSNPSQVAPLQMTGGGASQGITNFLNSPEYQLLYGNNAATLAQAGLYSPTNAFQADPGFQYNMDQALRQVNNSSAARGLLESSATQRDLLTNAQGLQNQQYQNWLGQNNTLFNQYQGQLANLTGLGAQNTGSQNAYNSGLTLAQLLGNANLQTGQNLSNAYLGTGQNISGLLANQGVYGGNAFLNTGAAQANNIFRGNQFTAQIMANQLASNAGTQSSQNNMNALNGGYSSAGNQVGSSPFGGMF